MRAEYTAHVQDAGLDESEDVEGLLGEPEGAQRALARLYLSAAALKGLREPKGQQVGFWILGCHSALLLLLWAGGNDQVGPSLTGVGAGGLVLSGLTLWARRLAPELRTLVTGHGGLWAVNFSLWVNWMVEAGQTGTAPNAFVRLLPLLWILWGATLFEEVRRLRRTLALEQPAVSA
ncbi:hypothetical protein [Deinococcus multiflagellatus]|uniref:Uncharacterized protein n=1 Tax=Deinococcus multiflagellatus TaxID=1656887 RepID=A0ABW1ZJP2_9DEIO|nr:hypothetical protein [Deinococcus multiflagellatus]MBZ9712275.1 hypothetical protein [Deinococcus multiflagellatus]